MRLILAVVAFNLLVYAAMQERIASALRLPKPAWCCGPTTLNNCHQPRYPLSALPQVATVLLTLLVTADVLLVCDCI